MSAMPVFQMAPLIVFCVSALTPASASQQTAPSANDYWAETVCKKEEVIGSRLAMKRTCLTRLQWAERARQERDSVNQMQKAPCLQGRSASGANSPSC